MSTTRILCIRPDNVITHDEIHKALTILRASKKLTDCRDSARESDQGEDGRGLEDRATKRGERQQGKALARDAIRPWGVGRMRVRTVYRVAVNRDPLDTSRLVRVLRLYTFLSYGKQAIYAFTVSSEQLV